MPFTFHTIDLRQVARPRINQTEAWRSGDRVLNYFTQMLNDLESFRLNLQVRGACLLIFHTDNYQNVDHAEQLLTIWDMIDIDYVRPLIATSVALYNT